MSKRNQDSRTIGRSVKQPLAPFGIDHGKQSVPQAVQRAIACFNAGNWVDAEQLCRMILCTRADCFDALQLLAVIAARTRRNEEAADLLRRAVAVSPNTAAAHLNYGAVLSELKR